MMGRSLPQGSHVDVIGNQIKREAMFAAEAPSGLKSGIETSSGSRCKSSPPKRMLVKVCVQSSIEGKPSSGTANLRRS